MMLNTAIPNHRRRPTTARRLLTLLALAAWAFPPSFSAAQTQTPDYTELQRRGEYHAALKVLDGMLEGRTAIFPIRWRVDRAKLRHETGQTDQAIKDLEFLRDHYLSTENTLYLALLYRERGRQKEYQETLSLAAEQAGRALRYSTSADLLLIQGRIAELQGHNPKVILNTFYAALIERAPTYAPGYIAAGDLAWRKWDYQLAAEYYEKALKNSEENQDALAGLAECYWKSNDPRVEETLQRLLALNPHHPRAHAIRAELALDTGKTDDALAIIHDALKINPNRPSMLALQAAAWFLRDNETSMTLTQKRALKYNPRASEVYRIPGRIISRHYRFSEAAELQRKALEVNPDDRAARAYYGFDLMRLGRDADGRKQLELAFKADPYNVVVFNMLNLLDSLKRFNEIKRGPFVLQLPKKEAPILQEEALALLDEAYELYSKKYGFKSEAPIKVQIFDNHDDFMVRSVGLPGAVGFLGICFGNLVTMDSPSARPKGEVNWRSVLWHEFVHVITLQKTNNRIPRWLSEGLSVYEETQRDASWGQRLNPQYNAIVKGEPLPGLDELEAYFTNAKSAMHLMFGYLASSEFVRFYIEEYGFDAMRKALEEIAEGRGAIFALAKAAGAPREKMDTAFQKYFGQRLAPYDNLPAPSPPANAKPESPNDATSVTLARLDGATTSSAFTAALHSAAAARQTQNWSAAEAALKKAHELFPDYAGADAPLRQLIALYERQNRPKDLRDALRKQLKADSTDLSSCMKLAALLVEDKAWPEVARAADIAFSIDPFSVQMRRAALTACQETGDKAKALVVLGQMALLDPPHAIDYRRQHIETLCALERWDEAKLETVRLLEETPYYWEAQQLLLQIVERKGEKK